MGAILDEAGNPILDEAGNPILDEESAATLPATSVTNTFNGAGTLTVPAMTVTLPATSVTNTFNGTGVLVVEIPPGPSTPRLVTRVNPLIALEDGTAQARSMVLFEVVDYQLGHMGWALPLKAESVQASISGAIKRQLQGFVLGPSDIRDINPFEDRIRVWWVFEDGSRWPQGVYMFGDSAIQEGTAFDRMPASMPDQGHVLQPGLTYPFGLAVNGSIVKAVNDVCDQCNIVERSIPGAPTVVVADPPNWQAGTSKAQVLDDLCKLAGWLPPYFDNMGVFRVKPPPDIGTEPPDRTYLPRQVRRATPVRHDNRMAAPNVYVVTGTGPSKSEITAVAYVDPNLPFSAENRHFEWPQVTRAQSLTSTEQAQRMVNALAAGAGQGGAGYTFDTNPDPSADMFETVAYRSVVYRETAYNLKLSPGGPHTHTLVQGGFPRAG